MFAFVVAPVDIPSDIVRNINILMRSPLVNDKNQIVNANTIQDLIYEDFANNYPYSYISKHKCDVSGNSLILYHLVFDFSNHVM